MDRTALESELAKLQKVSFLWAVTCCRGSRSEAEDVLQTTYLKIIDGRAQFEGRSTLKTWLFSVIRMTANENRRKSWLRSGLLAGWFEQTKVLNENEVFNSHDITEDKESRSQILKAMDQLPVRQREVIELVFYHDLTLSEAAAAMKVSIGTARVHYERGKKGLKDFLKEMGSTDE